MNKRHRIVILGGGFGGLLTARHLLRLANEDEVEIVLIDKNDIHVYTPWLYEVSTGFLLDSKRKRFRALKDTSGIKFSTLIKLYKSNGVRFRKAAVAKIEPQESHVVLEDGKTLVYDDLVIALGAEVNDYSISGVAEHALSMKTLESSGKLQRRLSKLLEEVRIGKRDKLRVCIAGAGATGVELASELANFLHSCDRVGYCDKSKVRISLVDASAGILNPASKLAQKWAWQRLEKLGVEIQVNTSCVKVTEHEVRLVPKGGEEYKMPCDLMVWAGGIKPNRAVAASELQKDDSGRAVVDATLMASGFENIHVLGDAASLLSPYTGKALPPLAQIAIGQAKIVANNIVRAADEKLLIKYKIPRSYSTIIPVGGKFAILEMNGLTIKGLIPYYFHRVIDLKYFLQIMPPLVALKAWRSSVTMFELND